MFWKCQVAIAKFIRWRHKVISSFLEKKRRCGPFIAINIHFLYVIITYILIKSSTEKKIWLGNLFSLSFIQSDNTNALSALSFRSVPKDGIVFPFWVILHHKYRAFLFNNFNIITDNIYDEWVIKSLRVVMIGGGVNIFPLNNNISFTLENQE